MTPTELATKWRADADVLEAYAPEMAKVCRSHADALDAALRSVDDDVLSLADAARASGYSPDRLRHKVSSGEIPNVGKKGAPRIRRGDLPLKKNAKASGFDAVAAARGLLRVSNG